MSLKDAGSLIRPIVAIVELLLPRLLPKDQVRVWRHLERVAAESAAMLEAQIEHRKRMKR